MGIDMFEVVYPVLLIDSRAAAPIRAVCGTGFILADVLVTCWHCVRSPLRESQRYAATRRHPDGTYELINLGPFAQDANGTDLALARITRRPEVASRLRFFRGEVAMGMDVSSFGYPLSERAVNEQGENVFTLYPRVLRGYLTRGFNHVAHGFGSIPSYELDMAAPEGLSGAPLLAGSTPEILGVVYGSLGAYTVEEEATVDPNSGDQRPEVRRLYTFGLACDLATLSRATAPATDGRALQEYAGANE